MAPIKCNNLDTWTPRSGICNVHIIKFANYNSFYNIYTHISELQHLHPYLRATTSTPISPSYNIYTHISVVQHLHPYLREAPVQLPVANAGTPTLLVDWLQASCIAKPISKTGITSVCRNSLMLSPIPPDSLVAPFLGSGAPPRLRRLGIPLRLSPCRWLAVLKGSSPMLLVQVP